MSSSKSPGFLLLLIRRRRRKAGLLQGLWDTVECPEPANSCSLPGGISTTGVLASPTDDRLVYMGQNGPQAESENEIEKVLPTITPAPPISSLCLQFTSSKARESADTTSVALKMWPSASNSITWG